MKTSNTLTYTARKPSSALSTAILALGFTSLFSVAQAAVFTAVADTWVNRGSIASNYGEDTTLSVRNDGGASSKTKDNIGIVRFDVSAFDRLLAGAELIFNESNSWNYRLYGIPDLAADELFDENALTFDSFAYKSTTLDGSLDPAGLTDLGTFTGGAPVAISSAALTTFVGNDSNGALSFVLFALTESGATPGAFNTSEASSGQPLANLTAVVPEPSVLGMGFLGLGIIFSLRRANAGRAV